jgi:UDP-N-acetylglucosamine 2-epimerase (non-hydrolysing)
MKKVFLIVGTRPNFVKAAPLYKALKSDKHFSVKLVHTGQHEGEMSDSFFREFELPKPDFLLTSGFSNRASKMARVAKALDLSKKLKVLFKEQKPDVVVVFGDVFSTLLAAWAAKKVGVKLAHVEAGLRSRDYRMPEEFNRIITDRLSDLHLPPSRDAVLNLLTEKYEPGAIHMVGNIMIDSLVSYHKKAVKTKKHRALNLESGEYIYLSMHRLENVENLATITDILSALNVVQKKHVIVFPIHPRTKKKVEDFGLGKVLTGMKNLKLIDPLSYFENLELLTNAKIIITDSGGIQEEAVYLGVPCVTIRKSTERPITVEVGANIVAGTKKENILKAVASSLKKGRDFKKPEMWDGQASKRIVAVLKNQL